MWLLLFRVLRLYDTARLFTGHQEYNGIFNACTIGIMLVIVLIFLDTNLNVARGWLLLAWIFSVTLVGLERFMVRRLVYWMRSRGHFMTPTYVVGANLEGIAIAEHLVSAPQFGINVIGFLDDNLSVGEAVTLDVIVHGSTTQAEALCHKFGIERMIVATSGVEREHLLSMFKRFVNVDDVSVWLSAGMYEMLTTGVRVQDIGSMAMVSVNHVRLTGINVVIKTLMDYIGALVGIVLGLPIFIAVYFLMRRSDPGPIIYRRRVVGVGGQQFDAFKFRTMVLNADEVLAEHLANNPAARAEWDKYEKLKDDPRITPIGHFLRRTSLDELPQLFNVLKGQMSLVGPRMITPEEVSRYGQWNMNIHTVKPGLTGMWQISGRSEITYQERVRLDMHYIRNYSVWLDLQILFWTIPVVLFSKGAY
jgi:exopolysaccharide biosynthesis polyprenyl glycosylphosphotransferase